MREHKFVIVGLLVLYFFFQVHMVGKVQESLEEVAGEWAGR